MTEHPQQESTLRRLTASDRCDRCTARALVLAAFPSGELLFCGHHWGQVEDAADAASVYVFDSRESVSPAA